MRKNWEFSLVNIKDAMRTLAPTTSLNSVQVVLARAFGPEKEVEVTLVVKK